jgi:pyridoxal phosphate enzyme (YggS family)
VIDPVRVVGQVATVRQRIVAAGGDPSSVDILAVTKGFGAEAVLAALGAGLPAVGENYAQELLDKAGSLAIDDPEVAPRWHFIGRLQRNKVRQLAPLVTLWQTVDRIELAAEIAKRAPGAAVLVQLNLSGEEQKGGCEPEDGPSLVSRCRDLGLEVLGLMGVGPAGPAEGSRAGFRQLVRLADDLALPVRSIGMSADLEVAVEEGSTLVRIGRDLFGERPPRP